MPNAWNPFSKTEAANEPDASKVVTPGAAPEKTPAELIAESVAGALKPVTDKLNEFTTRLDAIDTQTRRPVREEPTEGLPKPISVFDDEDAAIAQRVAPLFQRQLETEARMAYNEVKLEVTAKGYGEIFEKYGATIEAQLEGSPLVGSNNKLCRGDKAYIRNVIAMVVGGEAMKAGLKFGGRDRGFFIESAGGSADAPQGGTPVDGLNEAQRKFAAKHGLSNDQMKASVAKLKFYN